MPTEEEKESTDHQELATSAISYYHSEEESDQSKDRSLQPEETDRLTDESSLQQETTGVQDQNSKDLKRNTQALPIDGRITSIGMQELPEVLTGYKPPEDKN